MSCDSSPQPFRSVANHRSFVTDLVEPLPAQSLSPSVARNRVLAEDVRAQWAVPPFSNSAMDGFLVHESDLPLGQEPWTLKIAGDVPAGAVTQEVPRGQALRIMTGAPTGEDFDDLIVIPVEDTNIDPGPQELPQEITIFNRTPGRSHIRPRATNVAPGDLIASAGTPVSAGTLAALISTGITEVSVHALPSVTIFSSGDELVAPGEELIGGTIPDSNRPMLAELLLNHGILNVTQRHVSDTPEEFAAALREEATHADLIITSGGVSAGAFEVVRNVAGEQAWFGPVQMQPGKPQGAGLFNGVPLICLPGNPVSSYVSFFMFVLPVLKRLAGFSRDKALEQPTVEAYAGDFITAPKGRDLFIPARTSFDGTGRVTVSPFTEGGTGSHMVASLVGITGIISRPAGSSAVQPGEKVAIILTNLN